MINTPAYASLERYVKLEKAMLIVKDPLHPYNWMHPFLVNALRREAEFMRNNGADWRAKLEIKEPQP